MKNNQVGSLLVPIAILLAVCTLLGIVTYGFFEKTQFFEKNSDDSNARSTERSSSSDESKIISPRKSEQLTEVKNERSYVLHGLLLSYRLKHKSYPASTAEGWQQFAGESAEGEVGFVDPFVNKKYIFSTDDPAYGEIQYKFPSSCDKSTEHFASARSETDSYAFRLLYPKGVECRSSL